MIESRLFSSPWLRRLRAAVVFLVSLFVVVFGALAVLWFEAWDLAFPSSLISKSGKPEITVDPNLYQVAWCGMAIVFGLTTWRIRLRRLVILAPLVVIGCLILFRVVLDLNGYF